MNNENQYVKLTPFKMQILQSFPFIDEDFDAITNYELLCKVVEYLNTTVNNVNLLNDSFTALYNYVHDFLSDLNIQDEIDKKLDEMAEDGTLTNLISKYVDPIYQEYENRINRNVSVQNIRINNIENKVESAVSGAPLIASSIDDMTDTTKLYVNTTDGYVYYYDETEEDWVRGWVYQVEEPSDTVEEMKNEMYTKSETDFTYEVGTINSNNGINGNNSQRIRINNYLDITKYKLLSIDSAYDLNIFAYSDSTQNTYLGTTGWLTSHEYYTNDILDTYATAKYIRFIFRSHVERNMTLADVLSSNITVNEINFATNKKLIEETSVTGESIKCSFTQGSISSNNGIIDTTRNDRITDERFYKVSEIKNITCNSDYRILIANYSSNDVDSFIGVSDWLSSPVSTFTSNYIRIVVKKASEENITPSEVTNTKVNTKDISIKDYVFSQTPNSLCPNIIWQSRNVTDNICPPFSKDYVKLSVENEFDRIIVYVRKTTDGYYVSIHDDTINTEARNLDGTQISETISSNNQTLATLNSYDWGIKYGSKFAGMGVPMVEDVMKWASQYNIACSVHFSYGFTEQDAENIFQMACKYGLVDNMIVLPSNGMDFTRLGYFKNLNENISYYVGCTYEDLQANINSIKGLLTGKNDVYVQPYPWGTVVDNNFRILAKLNNLKLYNSTVMNENDLFNVVGFDKGYSIIETANVTKIKSTVRNFINSI